MVRLLSQTSPIPRSPDGDNNVVKNVLMYFHITISPALELSVPLEILPVIIMHCQRLSPHGAHTFHLFATPTSAAGAGHQK